jgi:hypothetical protein
MYKLITSKLTISLLVIFQTLSFILPQGVSAEEPGGQSATDLAFENIFIAKDPADNNSLEMTFDVVNYGAGGTVGSVNDAFTVKVYNQNTEELFFQQVYKLIDFVSTVPPSRKTIRRSSIVIDSQSFVEGKNAVVFEIIHSFNEINKQNNKVEKLLDVKLASLEVTDITSGSGSNTTNLPDLIINDVQLVSKSDGDYLKFIIKNNGTEIENSKVIVIRAEDTETGSVYYIEYTDGLKDTVEVLATKALIVQKSKTDYKLKATVDYVDVIDEANENNNVLEKVVSVMSKQLPIITNVNNNKNKTSVTIKINRPLTEIESKLIAKEKGLVSKIDNKILAKTKGRILLQVEEKGEAWYVDPVSQNKFYLKDGRSAYDIMRSLGLGINNVDLGKIPVGVEVLKTDTANPDTDGDGLIDTLEKALGLDPAKIDSDGDGFSDKDEIKNNYKATGPGKAVVDSKLVKKLIGRIVLQVQNKGEAWYINPVDGKRYFLGNGDVAYKIMRELSLGINNNDLRKIDVGEFVTE